jgi:TPP-dependent 2-oxoacid decarboxylase
MQYGSIGWSVGAVLGYAIGATDKRVIACIGDGSFQVRTRVDQNPTQTVPEVLWTHILYRPMFSTDPIFSKPRYVMALH